MATESPAQHNTRPNPNRAPPSRPVIWRTIKLQNEDAKRVANDTVRQTLRALARIDNVIPKLTKLEHAIQIRDWATTYISDCLTVITEEHTRMKKIKEDNGLDGETADYTGVGPYSIQISSPTSAQYVVILTKLDEVLADIECLWITGVIDMKQHVDAPHQLCRRVRTLSNELMLLQTRYEDAFRTLRENEHAQAVANREEHLAVKATAYKKELESGKVLPEVAEAAKVKEKSNGDKKPIRGRKAKPVPDQDGVVKIGLDENDLSLESETESKAASTE